MTLQNLINNLRIRKVIKIFLFLLFFLSCKKENSAAYPKNEVINKQNSTVTTLLVKFVDTGSLSLNTLVHQRGENFTLYGKKENEQKSVLISNSKPTVFTSYRIENNKTVSRQYISFENNTLSFEFKKHGSFFMGNRKNDILNILFPKNEDFHFTDKQSNPIKYIDSLESQHQLHIRTLASYSKDFNKTQSSILEDYLNLYYYFKIFNIDFSTVISSEAKEKLEAEYEELLRDVELLNKINTVLTKQIIYNSVRYTAFKNNSKQLYKNIELVDKRLRNTEAMTGFLDDLLRFSANTLSAADKNEIKKFLPKEIMPAKKGNTNVLTSSILLQSVKNMHHEKIKIQNILTTTNQDLILIDLWATWCLPCLQENPYWENAKKRYDGKIKFVKISIDTNEDKWTKYLEKHGEMHGNYIINNPQHLFIKKFNINSIPRYILFDRNFGVLSDDFTRPSDPNFNHEIEKYLP